MPLPLKEYDLKRINDLVTQMSWEMIGYNAHATLHDGKVEVTVECSSEDPCEITELEQLVKTAKLRIMGMEAGPFRVSQIVGDHMRRSFFVELSQGPEPACLPTFNA
ncbi:MAG: hypothetical protein ACR2IE_00220 [Candidatus Sumerlaeaceae bacterium]